MMFGCLLRSIAGGSKEIGIFFLVKWLIISVNEIVLNGVCEKRIRSPKKGHRQPIRVSYTPAQTL